MKKYKTPLYLQIANNIVNKIKSGELTFGDRLPSEHELAENTNVSRLTVRAAYQYLLEKRLLTAVQGKGTFVSEKAPVNISEYEGFKNVQKRNINAIFPEVDIFFAPIIKELEDLCSKNNYNLNIMFNDTVEREQKNINESISGNVSGIIITPYRSNKYNSSQNYKKLVDSQIPFIMFGKPPFDILSDCVMCDDVYSTYNSVSLFIKKGHRQILRLYNSLDDNEAIIERGEGYSLAFDKHLPDGEKLFWDCANPNWQEQIMSQIKSKNITALFCDNDMIAVQVHSLLFNNGYKIPQDIEMITYNSLDLNKKFNIDISIIDIPRIDMARCAFKHLNQQIDSMDNRSNMTHHIFTAKLIHLGSTKE